MPVSATENTKQKKNNAIPLLCKSEEGSKHLLFYLLVDRPLPHKLRGERKIAHLLMEGICSKAVLDCCAPTLVKVGEGAEGADWVSTFTRGGLGFWGCLLL